MKHFLAVVLALVLFLLITSRVFASSSYVLPYPGIMPGNKLYKIQELFDHIKKYYSFGDFATYKYNLEESDKKLVEAKTLFEYNQYPLALRALQQSDSYYKNVYPTLMSAQKNGKDIQEKLLQYHEASLKHREVLQQILGLVPETFNWVDEKKAPVLLHIKDALDSALELRLQNI